MGRILRFIQASSFSVSSEEKTAPGRSAQQRGKDSPSSGETNDASWWPSDAASSSDISRFGAALWPDQSWLAAILSGFARDGGVLWRAHGCGVAIRVGS